MANSTIRFWTEMTRVQAINALDKVMLGINSTGEAQYTNFADLKNSIGAISGAGFYPPVQPGGTLGNPSTISFTFLAPGSYNGGSLVVPDNTLGLGYWNGSLWSSTTIPLPQLAAVDNLTSTSITSALSANQGRVLNDSKEPSINKKTTINSSDTEFPTSKAVLNYGQTLVAGKENSINKKTTINNSDIEFPTSKAVLNYGQTLVVGKENSTNKKTTVNQSDTEFPTSFAVIKYVNTVVREYEKLTNKKDVINVFDNPNYYPTNIAVTKYVDSKIKDFSNVKFGGTIDETKDLSKPTEKIWYFAQRGTYNTNPSITIDSDLAILSYDGKRWTYAELNIEVQKDFIVFNTIAELRDISQVQIEYLRTGIVKGVIVNGYYKANDTPAPIQYYISDSGVDDGGSTIVVGDLKLEHVFTGLVDIRYYGGVGTADNSVIVGKILNKYGAITGDLEVEYPINKSVDVAFVGDIKFNIRTKTTSSINTSYGAVLNIVNPNSVTGYITSNLNNVHNFFLYVSGASYVDLEGVFVNGKEIAGATTTKNYFYYIQDTYRVVVRDSKFDRLVPIPNGVPGDQPGSARAVILKNCAYGEVYNNFFNDIQGLEDGDCVHIQTEQVGAAGWTDSIVNIFKNKFINIWKRGCKLQASGVSVFDNYFESVTSNPDVNARSAVSVYGSRTKVYNNRFNFKQSYSIFDLNTDNTLYDNEVSNNKGVFNLDGAASTAGLYAHVVCGNTENFKILNNDFRGTGGVYLVGGTANPNNNFVCKFNTFDGSGVLSATNSPLNGVIDNNIFICKGAGALTVPFYTIDVYNPNNGSVSNNTLINSIVAVRVRGVVTGKLSNLYNNYLNNQSGFSKINSTGVTSGASLINSLDSDSIDTSVIIKTNGAGAYSTDTSVNYNDIAATAWGLYSAAAVNAPPIPTETASLWWVRVQQTFTSGDKIQFAVPFRKDGSQYHRIYNSSTSTWGAWVREITDKSLATTALKGVVSQSVAVANSVLADATDLATALVLVNDLKAKLNAKLISDRNSGQQAV